MGNLAWHYTTGEKFELILASGFLKTSRPNMGGRQTERPLVWFTILQRWELSASYTGIRNGKLHIYSLKDTKEAGKGLIRLGYPQDSLIPWKDLRSEARISPSTQSIFIRERMVPFQWMGCFTNIPVTDLIIEVFNNDNIWERRELSSFPVLSAEAAAERFTELGYSSQTAPTLGLEE